eukprot:gnl/MRDRNA2_/MRDRNA2_142593_c0_seq1.p1 gnl/MRDRNA2_/MRDRNA2_142593_c0~~gnl/MRDRNA2_/MRDRNA2_142593_c0_seq1.p1  ORF type:complete len:360 (+),score=74.40 gnl/MRDRNA2_/MRDRNA2_142593_c0_seq1:119-1081(+)
MAFQGTEGHCCGYGFDLTPYCCPTARSPYGLGKCDADGSTYRCYRPPINHRYTPSNHGRPPQQFQSDGFSGIASLCVFLMLVAMILAGCCWCLGKLPDKAPHRVGEQHLMPSAPYQEMPDNAFSSNGGVGSVSNRIQGILGGGNYVSGYNGGYGGGYFGGSGGTFGGMGSNIASAVLGGVAGYFAGESRQRAYDEQTFGGPGGRSYGGNSFFAPDMGERRHQHDNGGHGGFFGADYGQSRSHGGFFDADTGGSHNHHRGSGFLNADNGGNGGFFSADTGRNHQHHGSSGGFFNADSGGSGGFFNADTGGGHHHHHGGHHR